MDAKQQADGIVEKIRELVQEGSASRVLLVRNGETLLNLSLNTGVLGAVVGFAAAPFAVLTAALVSFGMDCEIMVEKTDGTLWCLRDTPVGCKLEEAKSEIKETAKSFFGK